MRAPPDGVPCGGGDVKPGVPPVPGKTPAVPGGAPAVSSEPPDTPAVAPDPRAPDEGAALPMGTTLPSVTDAEQATETKSVGRTRTCQAMNNSLRRQPV